MAKYDMNINNIMMALQAVRALPDESFVPLMTDEVNTAIVNQVFIPITTRNTHLNADDTKRLFGISNLDDINELKKLTPRELAERTVAYYKARYDMTPDRNKGALRKATQCFGMGDKAEDFINTIFDQAGISRIPNGGIGGGEDTVTAPSEPSAPSHKPNSEKTEAQKRAKRMQKHKTGELIVQQSDVPVASATEVQPDLKERTQVKPAEVPVQSGTEEPEGLAEYHVFEPLTLDSLLETPPLDFLTDNLIVKNTVNVFFAPAKTGKTYLCLNYAICLAMGIPFLGMENHLKRNVGYLNLDMFRGGFNDRVKQVIKGFNPNATPEYISNILNRVKIIDREAIRSVGGHIPNFYKEEYLDDLRNFIITNDIEFLILDTFARIRAGSAENDNDDMAITLQNMEKFFSPLDCGALPIHHTGKDGKLRGASAIIDNAEFVFGLRKVNGSNKHLQIYSDTPRYTDVFELDVYPVFEQCTNEETGASHADSYFLSAVDPELNNSDIIDFMKARKNPWMSKKTIGIGVGGRYEDRLKEIDALYAKGILERIPAGRGFNYRLKVF